LSLPLRDDSVDACLSYTVIEHLPNEQFLGEQARVCRRGGRVIAMVTLPDKSLASMPEGWPAMSPDERRLWEAVRGAFEAANDIRGVGGHWPDPAGLPRLFEKLGLTGVRVDALALPVVADDARLTPEQRTRVIDADLRIALERIEMARGY
jgi:SAM-dependent methyltransferase